MCHPVPKTDSDSTIRKGERARGHPSAVFNLDDTAFAAVGRSKDAIEKSSDGRGGGVRRLPLSLQRKHKPVGVGAHPFSRSLQCLSVD